MGHVHIGSADPNTAPTIQPNYLSTDYDQDLMLRGMRLIRALTETESLGRVIEDEVYPGRAVQTDEQMMDFIRQNAWTVFHPCGTCRMGSSPQESVVDSKLRVHGLQGLRIADASVFPTIPTGNTNAPAIMVGEKASDLILADAI